MDSIQKINERKSFKLIAISLPILFFIVLEFLLRIFHFGYSPRLFLEDTNNSASVHNNIYISRLFFNDWETAPNAYVQHFSKNKPENTCRIFVLGESSALGFPYNHRGSFPTMLQYMLEKTCVEKRIEIINLAITGINSYAILSFSDQIIKMDPDIILVYTGHNEYYGALGVGSRHKLGFNRALTKAIIELKKLRLFQLGFRLSGMIRNQMSDLNQVKDLSLMIKLAGNQEIEYNSKVYNKGLKQFELNMSEMLEKFSRHQIPVYLSDIVSNSRGQKPFISKLSGQNDTTLFMELFHKGQKKYSENFSDSAFKYFQAAGKFDSSYAMNNFLMAEILYDQGKFIHARRYYCNARELDVLRFRAPKDINRIIRNLSGQFANVYFVKSSELFMQKSPYGILGNELFTDHLHPNLEGNFLLASVFYTTLKESQEIGKTDPGIGITTLRSELPVSVVDSLQGTWLIQYMKQKWPFFDTVKTILVGESYPEKLAFRLFNKQVRWDAAMDSLYKYYLDNHQTDKAIRIAKAYNLEYPDQFFTAGEIGRLYQQKGNFTESFYYYRKAYEKSCSIDFARKIVIVLMKMDKLHECGYYLDIIRKQAPGDKTGINLSRMIENVIKAKRIVQNQPQHSESVKTLARYYLYIGNLKVAKIYIDLLPDMGPNDPLMKEYYKKLKEADSVNLL